MYFLLFSHGIFYSDSDWNIHRVIQSPMICLKEQDLASTHKIFIINMLYPALEITEEL